MHYKSLLQAVGNTPLVRINLDTPATMLAKLEYLNPGGSIKDRSALFMIEKAEEEGILKPGGTIIDASSGNAGIAVAMIGALKGYRVIISTSNKTSAEKLGTIKAYGAEVVISPVTASLSDPESYHSKAVEIHKNTPNSFMPNQYFNVSNAEAHYRSLGPEIWEQTNGEVTHFFAAAGTGGHVSGAGRYLKEQNPNVRVVAFDSNNSWRSTNGHPKPYAIEGMGIDFESPVFNETYIDEVVQVADEDALPMLSHLACTHGLLGGPSTGAVAYAAQRYAKENLNNNHVGVMIFGDSGRAYLTKQFYGAKKDSSPVALEKNEISLTV